MHLFLFAPEARDVEFLSKIWLFCLYCKIHACALVRENSFFVFSFVCWVGSMVPGRVPLVHQMYEKCSAPARSKGTMWTVALSRILQPVRDANVGSLRLRVGPSRRGFRHRCADLCQPRGTTGFDRAQKTGCPLTDILPRQPV